MPTSSKPCRLSTCRHCRPGRMCAESARWEADEDHYEEVDRSHDAFHARMWERSNPALEEGFDHPPSFLNRWGETQWSDPAYKYGRPPGV